MDTKRKHKERRTNVKNKSSKTKYILQVRVSKEKICSSNKETIQRYIKLIKNLGGKINKAYLNKLRKMLNLEPIMIMP